MPQFAFVWYNTANEIGRIVESVHKPYYVNNADPKTFPSSVGIDIMLADQIGEYNEGDLQKIAMDIKAGVPHAQDAFHYVYSRMMGWE